MINQKKFFKICKVVGVKEIADRLNIRNTTIYNWIYTDRIPPLKWVTVSDFMKEFEGKNANQLKDRIKDYDRKMAKEARAKKKEKETGRPVVGILIGHNRKRQGAYNYHGETEFSFNSHIANKVMALLPEDFKVVTLMRPTSGGYTTQCKAVAKNASGLGVTHVISLHFNWGINARGFEFLMIKNVSHIIKSFAAHMGKDLSVLGIKKRHGSGIKILSKGNNGYTMLKKLQERNIHGVIVEPCFANERTEESEAIFEDEDRYASIIADSILKMVGPITEMRTQERQC